MRKQTPLFILVMLCIFSLIWSHQETASPVDDVAARLEGLDIDTFLEQSFTALLLRDPERVTQLGLSEQLGIGNDRLTNLSDAYIRETHRFQTAILKLLNSYDWSQFTPEQHRSAEVRRWYLEDRVAGSPFMSHDFPIHQFLINVHKDLLRLLTDIHPIRNEQDAKDYVSRLTQVKTKFEQVIEGLQRREQLGIIPPKFLLQQTLDDINQQAQESAQGSPFYTVFHSKLDTLSDLPEAEKILLLEDAARAIESFVLPGYHLFSEYLRHLKSMAGNDSGV